MKIIDKFIGWLAKQVLTLEETNIIIFPNEIENNAYPGFNLKSNFYFTKKNKIYINLEFSKAYDILRIIRVSIRLRYDKDGKQYKKLIYNELLDNNQNKIKCIIDPDHKNGYELHNNEFLLVTVYYSKIK